MNKAGQKSGNTQMHTCSVTCKFIKCNRITYNRISQERNVCFSPESCYAVPTYSPGKYNWWMFHCTAQ